MNMSVQWLGWLPENLPFIKLIANIDEIIYSGIWYTVFRFERTFHFNFNENKRQYEIQNIPINILILKCSFCLEGQGSSTRNVVEAGYDSVSSRDESLKAGEKQNNHIKIKNKKMLKHIYPLHKVSILFVMNVVHILRLRWTEQECCVLMSMSTRWG